MSTKAVLREADGHQFDAETVAMDPAPRVGSTFCHGSSENVNSSAKACYIFSIPPEEQSN
jgi:hypothetical protein